MPRIAGVNIPQDKRIETAITYIYGIGSSLGREILTKADIDFCTRSKDLTTEQASKIQALVEKNTIEGELRREKMLNIKRLKDINSYRGLRHSKGLPVRGQKTKTNSRTVRDNIRKTTVSGKRKLEKT